MGVQQKRIGVGRAAWGKVLGEKVLLALGGIPSRGVPFGSAQGRLSTAFGRRLTSLG
jgi:hypothetical protein